MWRFKVASFSSRFLCGAVFGWVGEGVVVDTLYGNATNPFPLSISFTGLSWHALLSVGVGWHLIGNALTDERVTRTALISLAVGVGWGLWAVWWPAELGKEVDTSVTGASQFTRILCSITVPSLPGSILGLARPDWFRAGNVWQQSFCGGWLWCSSWQHESSPALCRLDLAAAAGGLLRGTAPEHTQRAWVR